MHGQGNDLVLSMSKECCPLEPDYHSCDYFVVNKEVLSGQTLTLSSPFPVANLTKQEVWPRFWKFGNDEMTLRIANFIDSGKMYGSLTGKEINEDGLNPKLFYHILPCGPGLNVLRKIEQENLLPIHELPQANPSNFFAF